VVVADGPEGVEEGVWNEVEANSSDDAEGSGVGEGVLLLLKRPEKNDISKGCICPQFPVL
jgi:hypothetical protein